MLSVGAEINEVKKLVIHLKKERKKVHERYI